MAIAPVPLPVGRYALVNGRLVLPDGCARAQALIVEGSTIPARQHGRPGQPICRRSTSAAAW